MCLPTVDTEECEDGHNGHQYTLFAPVDTEEGEDGPSGQTLYVLACICPLWTPRSVRMATVVINIHYLPTVDTEEGEDGPSGPLLYVLACICPLWILRRVRMAPVGTYYMF